MISKKLLLASMVALSVLACPKTSNADEASTAPNEARETAQSVVNSWCDIYAKHDPKAMSMLFVPNGVVLPPDGSPLVQGRDALERNWVQSFKNIGGRETITVKEAVPIGDDAIVAVTEFRIVGEGPTANKVVRGRSAVTLAKTADGWRFVSIAPQLQPPPSH